MPEDVHDETHSGSTSSHGAPRDALQWLERCRQTLKNEGTDWDLLALLAPLILSAPDDAGPTVQKVLRLVDVYETGSRALRLSTPSATSVRGVGSEELRGSLLDALDRLREDEAGRRRDAAFISAFGAAALLIGVAVWTLGALLEEPGPALWSLWLGVALAVIGVIATTAAALLATAGSARRRLWGAAAAAVSLVVVGVVVLFGPRADAASASATILALAAVATGVVTYAVVPATRTVDLLPKLLAQLLTASAIQSRASTAGTSSVAASAADVNATLLAQPRATSDTIPSEEPADRDASPLIDWIGLEVSLKADEEGRRSRRWQGWHYLLGGSAAAAAGVAGITLSIEGATWIVGVGALLAAVLSGATTAINPGRMWEEAHTAQRTFDALRRQITIMQELYVPTWDNPKRREALDYVLQRFEQTAGTPEHQTFWQGSQRT